MPSRQTPFDMPSFADALNRIGFFIWGQMNFSSDPNFTC
jgi:hypothetical protein